MGEEIVVVVVARDPSRYVLTVLRITGVGWSANEFRGEGCKGLVVVDSLKAVGVADGCSREGVVGREG